MRRFDSHPSRLVVAAPPTSPNSSGVIIVHRHDEFHRIVKRGRGPHDRAASLQVLPAQRTIDAVEDKNHATFGSFDPHFHEALEERRVIKIVSTQGPSVSAQRWTRRPRHGNSRSGIGLSGPRPGRSASRPYLACSILMTRLSSRASWKCGSKDPKVAWFLSSTVSMVLCAGETCKPAARPCGPGPRLTMRWNSPCPWTMITPGELGHVGGAAATTSKNAQSLCRCANPTPRTAPAST